MTSSRLAWITSAGDDEGAWKAIYLARSLRKVYTSKTIVVLVTPNVSNAVRDHLENFFDLVTVYEPKRYNHLTNTVGGEDLAKIYNLVSIKLFDKCVYLSPNTMALKNCDDIFEKDCAFACCFIGDAEETIVDSSVFLYDPKRIRFLKNVYGALDGNIWKYLLSLMENNDCKVDRLDERYNYKIQANLETEDVRIGSVCVVNFVDSHPLDTSGINFKALSLDASIIVEQMEYKTEPIAIVGMSFRLPGANNVDEFTDLLMMGKEGIRQVPPFRWTKEHSYFPCKTRNLEAGFLKDPIDEFDAKFFGISPKDAEYLDPQQRLLHEVSWEALEDAMIDPLTLRGTQTSFFVGSWMYDYQTMAASKTDIDFFRVYFGNSIGSSAARLSHFYNTMGPLTLSVATESGCSSGIVAVDMAVKSLRNGETNLALACGVNLLIHPFDQSKLSFVVAPDGRCKTFDAKADGFGRAEACAVLVMKRLSDAVRNGDNIWGLIRGSAIRQEGVSKSLGTPTLECESLAMETAMRDAGVEPKDVTYIEAHGTGTPVGDPLEVAAIAKAYSRNRTEPLVIGSVKTNVGHTESVSGITGIIKVLLSMRSETIPKHLNLETINPEIDLSVIPAEIPLSPLPWPRKDGKNRLAGVSSFGISGTDGHVIIEEPPVVEKNTSAYNGMERPLHILKVSAKSPESLNEILKRYLEMFGQHEKYYGKSGKFADVAFSTNTGRATFNHRAVIIAENFLEAANIIQQNALKQSVCSPTSDKKICFLFTGQGSQYANMGDNLYKTSPVFKHHFDKCEGILKSEYRISLTGILWKDPTDLHRTIYSQTSIFVIEYCLLKLWESWGVKPDYVLGHSLGEFAAAVAAGILTFRDALKLVVERSLLINQLPQGKMLVIKANKNTVDDAISRFQKVDSDFWIDYAAFNSAHQTVVAGDPIQVENFAKFCESRSLQTITLAASHAFHSRHMDPMLEKYREIASSIKSLNPEGSSPKFISGILGRVIETSEMNATYWIRHTRENVNFIEACKTMKAEGCTLFLEIGPHPVLSAFMMTNIEDSIKCLPSLRRKQDDWDTLLGSLADLYLSDWKGKINWKGFDIFYPRKRVTVPFYQFNRKSIWTQFQKIYSKVHPLLGSIVPTATTDAVYQAFLTSKSPDYLHDHLIGNTVIFPGAGFLEMCLAGGHSAVQGFTENLTKPKRPVLVKNFRIQSPLALYDSNDSRIQTVIKLSDKGDDDEIGYLVTIHQYDISETGEETGKWVQKASATFLPVVSSLPEELHTGGFMSIESIKESSTTVSNEIQEFYEKARDVGLRFGPTFQSVERGWKSDASFLAELKVPANCNNYLTHPILIDAMLQTLMVGNLRDHKNRKKLHVPVEIKEFIWLKEINSENLYVYATKNNAGDIYCKLIDERGTPYAYMQGAEYMETTVKLIEGMVEKRDKLPRLWKESWKSYPGPLQNSADLSVAQEHNQSEEKKRLIEEANNVGPDEKRFYNCLVNLSNFYIIRALQNLRWNPNLHERFRLEGVISTQKILTKYTKYLKFYFIELEKTGCLSTFSLNGEESFVLLKPLEDIIQETSQHSVEPKYNQRDEYKLIKEIGDNLDSILTGKIEPLGILFPEASGKPSAEKYYMAGRDFADVIIELQVKPTLYTFWDSVLQNQNYDNNHIQGKISPVLKILEVGAGTGIMADAFLHAIRERNFEVEYYFTDVSAAFFGPAEKTHKDFLHFMKFKKLDMELDPLQQGFCPEYFDLIIACEVLHVSSELSNTLKNLQIILKPGGMIMIFEHLIQDPRTTFVFGLIDGFWRSKDRSHPYLTSKDWQDCLLSNGFERAVITPYYNSIYGVIAAVSPKSKLSLSKYTSFKDNRNVWLIFDNNSLVTQMLEIKFKTVGRYAKCVPQISPSTTTLSCDEMEALIRSYIVSNIEAILEDGNKLEGIVYLWPFSKESDANWNISIEKRRIDNKNAEVDTKKCNRWARMFLLLRANQRVACSPNVHRPTSNHIDIHKIKFYRAGQLSL